MITAVFCEGRVNEVKIQNDIDKLFCACMADEIQILFTICFIFFRAGETGRTMFQNTVCRGITIE